MRGLKRPVQDLPVYQIEEAISLEMAIIVPTHFYRTQEIIWEGLYRAVLSSTRDLPGNIWVRQPDTESAAP